MASRLLSMHALPRVASPVSRLTLEPQTFHWQPTQVAHCIFGTPMSGLKPLVDQQSGGALSPSAKMPSYHAFDGWPAARRITTSRNGDWMIVLSGMRACTGWYWPWYLMPHFEPL